MALSKPSGLAQGLHSHPEWPNVPSRPAAGRPMPMNGARFRPFPSARAMSLRSILINRSTASSRASLSSTWRHWYWSR
jgi:hypothetical protein